MSNPSKNPETRDEWRHREILIIGVASIATAIFGGLVTLGVTVGIPQVQRPLLTGTINAILLGTAVIALVTYLICMHACFSTILSRHDNDYSEATRWSHNSYQSFMIFVAMAVLIAAVMIVTRAFTTTPPRGSALSLLCPGCGGGI